MQLFRRGLRWRSCEGSLEVGQGVERRGPDTPTLPAACRRLRGAGTRSQRGRCDGPRGRGLGTLGRDLPSARGSPLRLGCLSLSPRSPSAYPSLHSRAFPLSPRPLTRLRGPSITSIDPGVSGGPRRSGGAWAHGGAARERRRGGWREGSSQNPEPAVRAQELRPRHFRLRRRVVGRSLRRDARPTAP